MGPRLPRQRYKYPTHTETTVRVKKGRLWQGEGKEGKLTVICTSLELQTGGGGKGEGEGGVAFTLSMTHSTVCGRGTIHISIHSDTQLLLF